MKSLELTRPNETRKVADWAQLQALVTRKPISKTEAASIVAEVSGGEPEDGFIASVWSDLETEQKLHRAPPFRIKNQVLEPLVDLEGDPVYLALMFWACYGDPDSDGEESSSLFEQVACHAFCRYLSGHAMTLRRKPDGAKLKSAKAKIEFVAEALGERLVETPEAYNDRGTDLVAWKPFHDQRSGKLVVLAQCAAGDNWRSKSRDVVVEAWQQYIHFSCKPMTGFAVPILISKSRWHDLSVESGLVLDRPRIHNLLPTEGVPPELAKLARGWCTRQIKRRSR